MNKRKVVFRRRLAVSAAALAVLALLFILLRTVWGLMTGAGGSPAAAHYTGEPVSISEYDNSADDRPAVEWNLMLVNEKYPLAESYVPVLATVDGRWEVDERIVDSVAEMLADCRKEGLEPLICSAYRSVDKQEELFVSRIARSEGDGLDGDAAVASAATVVAVPGASEHHTGLALDIVSNGYQLLDEGQEGTPENQWLREHCADYGFILRYPVGSTDETGIIYEPWHFRYVGKKAAKEIMERGITFEAYSGAV